MKNQLAGLIKKYDLKDMQNRVDALDNVKVKIGFLGEFNSGKSSLINALLGEKVLPAMVKPTTKSIIEVEPTENIDVRKFYKEEGSEWIEVKGSEFSRIALGEDEGTVKVKTPSNDYLKKDFVFIDTPGISSLEDMDKDITYGYLPFLDGAVICQDIQQGTLTQSIIEFITDKEIRPIINNFLFVLTRKDTKQEGDAQKVLENVIKQIKLLNEEKDLGIRDIEQKVSLSSSEDLLTQKNPDAIDDFKKSLEFNIIDKFSALKEQRQEKEFILMLKEIKDTLEYRIENMGTNDDELKVKEYILKEDLEQIEKDRKKVERDLESFRKELNKKLSVVVENYIPILKKVEDDEIGGVIGEMHNELSGTTKSSVEHYFKEMDIPELPSGALYGVESFIKNINKTKDVTVMISTAAATAYIAGATSLAGNTAEAGAGAGAKVVGQAAAKEAGKKVAISAGKRMLLGIAQTLKEINPLEHIGEAAKQFYLDSSLFDKLKMIAANMSFEIYRDMKNSLEQGIFTKLKDDIYGKQKSLELIRKQKKSGQNSLEELKKVMFDDVLDLKVKLANTMEL